MTHKRKPVGRPKSIDLETLLQVAAEMDLATISMRSLAERLGVGVATVYRYVKDRDALVRLAAARAAHRTVPEDTGEDWRELIHAYADSMFSALSNNSSLMHAYLDGHLGAELEIEMVDRFVASLVARGFAAEQALGIFRAVGLLTIGTAAATLHLRAHTALHGGPAVAVEHALDRRGKSELPALRRVVGTYVSLIGNPDLHAALTVLIAGLETTFARENLHGR